MGWLIDSASIGGYMFVRAAKSKFTVTFLVVFARAYSIRMKERAGLTGLTGAVTPELARNVGSIY